MKNSSDFELDAGGGSPLPHRPSINILVAEGDPAVRSYLTSVLTQQGYRVTAAADGADALLKARCYGPALDILLTDFALPSLNGIELALAVRDLAPEVGIVLMSGVLHGTAPGVTYLRKPFTTTALLQALGQLFEK